jgi:hypothetical protein
MNAPPSRPIRRAIAFAERERADHDHQDEEREEGVDRLGGQLHQASAAQLGLGEQHDQLRFQLTPAQLALFLPWLVAIVRVAAEDDR